ncbi:hypothetical protein LJC52_05035, partial [Bacteroidales bacterium OttesenSCG-928-A17]|nr:hypothetical protein [Bacteroidales bacterium OttesenSCG-928-A17]
LEKKYQPNNYTDLETKVAREIVSFCARKQIYPQYGIANYNIIKRHKKNTLKDDFLLLTIYCPIIVIILAKMNRMILKITSYIRKR